MTSRTKKITAVAVAVASMAAVVSVALFLSSGSTPLALPEPNGYDVFVKAGQLLAVDSSGYQDASLGDLESMVNSNAPALALLREGLQMEACVPLDYVPEDANNWANDLPQFKALASALCAEARYELSNGNPDRAAEVCVETIDFGVECCRGGVLINRMVGIAVVGVGSQMLNQVRPELDASSCKQTSLKLEAILNGREPLSSVAARERSWSKSAGSFRDFFAAMMLSRSLTPYQALAAPAFSKCEQKEAQLDQLVLSMACRAYELENGHPPAAAAELVPEYLKSIPIDPDSGNPMELN